MECKSVIIARTKVIAAFQMGSHPTGGNIIVAYYLTMTWVGSGRRFAGDKEVGCVIACEIS